MTESAKVYLLRLAIALCIASQVVYCTTYSYTGGVQTYIVPSNGATITATVCGAAGGSCYGGTSPGNGGCVTTTLTGLTMGMILYVYVGGAGSQATTSSTGGGYNGGGNAGVYQSNAKGGGGGGGSDIRTSSSSLTSRIAVGGGGGGCGYANSGGYGGGLVGGDASGGSPTGGGYGGTQSAGGNVAREGYGSHGAFGVGGDAWSTDDTGGGGGGWYGGGGGGGGGTIYAGGGGSSYSCYTITSNTQNTQSGNGQVTITPNSCTSCSSTSVAVVSSSCSFIPPTAAPSAAPSVSYQPSVKPSVSPSVGPSVAPSRTPTVVPTKAPTVIPSIAPSLLPTIAPSDAPTAEPSTVPSDIPTVEPTIAPSPVPTIKPSELPTVAPSIAPTVTPTHAFVSFTDMQIDPSCTTFEYLGNSITATDGDCLIACQANPLCNYAVRTELDQVCQHCNLNRASPVVSTEAAAGVQMTSYCVNCEEKKTSSNVASGLSSIAVILIAVFGGLFILVGAYFYYMRRTAVKVIAVPASAVHPYPEPKKDTNTMYLDQPTGGTNVYDQRGNSVGVSQSGMEMGRSGFSPSTDTDMASRAASVQPNGQVMYLD